MIGTRERELYLILQPDYRKGMCLLDLYIYSLNLFAAVSRSQIKPFKQSASSFHLNVPRETTGGFGFPLIKTLTFSPSGILFKTHMEWMMKQLSNILSHQSKPVIDN